MRNLLFAALTWQSLPINYSQNRAFGHFYGGGSKRLVGSGDGRICQGIKYPDLLLCHVYWKMGVLRGGGMGVSPRG